MNMVSMDQVDDRTFRVNFSADGLVKLQDRIDSKLKEFLGDYADDSLVEYVLVLITNGRHKKEAKSELDVFLGDDSDSFVSWLWDHLTSNLDQYAQSEKPDPDETLKPKATSVELDGTNISCHLHSDKQAELDEAFKKRRNRKWRTLTSNESQQPSLCSLVVGEVEHERKASLSVCHTKQSLSPNPPSKRKRGRADEHENMIEHERPKPTIGALSRLFQSAVRDAVATTRPSSSLKEAGAKRLCCVVSTPNGDSALKGRSHRIQSIARVPNTEAKAVEDAVKVRSSRNVFDQLNHGVGASETAEKVASVRYNAVPDEYDDYYRQMEEIQQMDYYHPQVDDHQVNHGLGASESAEEVALFRHNAVLDEYDDYYRQMEEIQQMGYHHPQMDDLQVDYYHNLEKSLQMHVEQDDYSSKYKGNKNMQWNETGLASGFLSDYQGYDVINVINDRIMDVTQTGSSRGRKRDDSLMVQYNMAQKADQVSHIAQLKNPPVSAPNASRKILNISVNVNTWKSPHFQPAIDATELDIRRSLQQNEVGVGKSSVCLMKENKNSNSPDGNGKVAIQRLNETQKNTTSSPSLYSTGHSLEDTDARTIVLNNVHFAATKDSLSRHFNRFGEVLKVFILTDVATGQPKGSAYVEFMRKEAAENALSLDGASFMSRILKVAKKSSDHQESTPTLRCPRVSQGSPLTAARFSQAPAPRVFPGAYRAQPPAKPRAKSLQWKRDTQPSTSQKVSSVTGNKSNAPPSAGRGLTYIRKT